MMGILYEAPDRTLMVLYRIFSSKSVTAPLLIQTNDWWLKNPCFKIDAYAGFL